MPENHLDYYKNWGEQNGGGDYESVQLVNGRILFEYICYTHLPGFDVENFSADDDDDDNFYISKDVFFIFIRFNLILC